MNKNKLALSDVIMGAWVTPGCQECLILCKSKRQTLFQPNDRYSWQQTAGLICSIPSQRCWIAHNWQGRTANIQMDTDVRIWAQGTAKPQSTCADWGWRHHFCQIQRHDLCLFLYRKRLMQRVLCMEKIGLNASQFLHLLDCCQAEVTSRRLTFASSCQRWKTIVSFCQWFKEQYTHGLEHAPSHMGGRAGQRKWQILGPAAGNDFGNFLGMPGLRVGLLIYWMWEIFKTRL